MEEGMDKDLYNAAMSGDVALLEMLHKNKSGILGETTPYGDTALHIAASYGRLNFVKKFIELLKRDPEALTNSLKAHNMDDSTSLHKACSVGRYHVVKVLLEEDKQLARATDLWGATPVFKAAEKGHYKIVKQLLPLTPDDYLRRGDGQTPLHVAVRNSKKDVVGLLLDENPHLSKKVDNLGRTALHIASSTVFSSSERIWKWDVHPIGKMLILKNRPACHKVDGNGETPLHIAVKKGNADLTEEILKNEPSCIHMLDGKGRTVLHLAVDNATRIYDRNARDLRRIMDSVTVPTFINCNDDSGQTALAIAMKNRVEDPEVYKAITGYLLRKGASPEDEETAHDEGKKDASTAQPIGVTISLIATVAFAVAFTLPQVGDSFSNRILFHLLVISDTMAFCYSLGVALLLVYVHGIPNFRISAYIFAAISVAGASLAVTFGAAVHLAVAPKYPWLPYIVWVMLLTMIYTGIISFHGKLFLFGEDWKHVLLIIVHPAKLFLTSAADLLILLFSIPKTIVSFLRRGGKLISSFI